MNHTGIFASAQFALTFPTLKSILPPEILSSLRSKAEKLANTDGLNPLTKTQYRLQADWVTANDVAYMEYIMYPTGGRTPVAPESGAVYISMWSAIMVHLV